jgi:pentatricopeptide repeat protein
VLDLLLFKQYANMRQLIIRKKGSMSYAAALKNGISYSSFVASPRIPMPKANMLHGRSYNEGKRAVSAQKSHRQAMGYFGSEKGEVISPASKTHYYKKKITDLVSRCKMHWAVQVFNNMKEKGIKPDDETFTVLIEGCATENYRSAFSIYQEMRSAGKTPSLITFVSLIDACVQANQLDKALSLYEDMKAATIQPNLAIYNTLIKECVREDRADKALIIYEDMQAAKIEPSRVIYNSLAIACARANKLDRALFMCEQINNMGLKPDKNAYNYLIIGCVQANKLEKAFSFYKEMSQTHTELSAPAYINLINACASVNNLSKAISLIEEMQQARMQPDVATCEVVINACVKNNDATNALLFIKTIKPTGILNPEVLLNHLLNIWLQNKSNSNVNKALTPLYNNLIHTSVQLKDQFKAFASFQEMQKVGIAPNQRTYKMLIDACAKENDLTNTLGMIRKMKKAGFLKFSMVLQKMFDAWINEKIDINFLKVIYQRIFGITFFKPQEEICSLSINCYALSSGSACLLLGIHLDALQAPFTVRVVTRNPFSNDHNVDMKMALQEFVKQHYPSWIVLENPNNPGSLILQA